MPYRSKVDIVPERWRLPVAVCLSLFVVGYHFYVMTVAMPQIVREFNTSVGIVQGAMVLLGLIVAALVPSSVGLGDRVGEKVVYLGGLVLYSLGASVIILGRDVERVFLGFSLISGLGLVPMSSIPWNWMSTRYRGGQRDIAYFALSMSLIIGGLAGSLVGGMIVSTLGWRGAFTPPIVLAILLLVLVRPISNVRKRKTIKIDWLGSVLSLFGLACLLFGISLAGKYGWWTPREVLRILGVRIPPFELSVVPILMIVGTTMIGGYVFWLRRTTSSGRMPILRAGLYGHRQYMAACSIGMLATIATAGFIFILYLFVPVMMDTNAFQTALTVVPYYGGQLSAMLLSVFLLGRWIAQRAIIRIGFLLLGVGLFMFHGAVSLHIDVAHLWRELALIGTGSGLIVGQVGNLALTLADKAEPGASNAIYNTLQDLGYALAVAIFGAAMISLSATSIVDQALVTVQLDMASEDRQELVYFLEEAVQTFTEAELDAEIATWPEAVQQSLSEMISTAVTRSMRTTLRAIIGVVIVGFFASGFLPTTKMRL